MKDKFVFKYDKNTKKGIIITNKIKKEINLEEKHCQGQSPEFESSESFFGSGSCGGGYGLHLI